MKCEICGKGMKEGVSLYRVNRKGIAGVWRCPNCLTNSQAEAIDPVVLDICEIIQNDRTQGEGGRE